LGLLLSPSAHSQSLDSFAPSLNDAPSAVAEQIDGKLVLAGAFTNVAGNTRKFLARLHSNGTLDLAFTPSVNKPINCLAIQADGKILVGGGLTDAGGQPRRFLARFYPDGALDDAFQVSLKTNLQCLAIQADGKILAGGGEFGGESFLVRLEADGSLDPTFSYAGAQIVRLLRVQPDGKILLVEMDSIMRLNADGTVDRAFSAKADQAIFAFEFQPEGKVLVGGGFKILSGVPCNYFGRLNTDGSLDASFVPEVNFPVHSSFLQTDGKILIGGDFWLVGGQPRSYFGRVLTNGTVDTSFIADCDRMVWRIAAQSNGQILVSGGFSSILGQSRRYLARLYEVDPLAQSIVIDAGGVRWLRSGSGPEVSAVTFESSTNGQNWTLLGPGERIPAGYQLSTPQVPPNATIRVHGYANAATSTWSVESSVGPPAFVSQSDSKTVAYLATTNFQVLVAGSAPMSFQWLRNGSLIDDVANMSGTASSSLVISNASGADSGTYSVMASNSLGTTTGVVSRLTVLDPFISTQPSTQTVSAGQGVLLSVAVRGTFPFGYQWCKDGSALVNGPFVAGATSGLLTLSKVLGADSGEYTVIVTNAWGSVTGPVATLLVKDPLITRQPPNVQTNGGATAVFSVTAVGTDLQYQWQKADVDIPGATASSLALPNVQRVDADSYTVVVSNRFGAVTSTAATLTVNLAALNSFNPGADFSVYGLGVQPDGKLLVAGRFKSLCGQGRTYLGRLNVDGTLDSSFNPGPNSVVNCVAIQDNGRILVGGEFTQLYGQPRKCIARLEADGALDARFDPGAGGSVYALLAQPDGKILVGGNFTNLAGESCSRLGRLDRDGTLDSTFDAGTNGTVFSLALQSDGKILVAGPFSTLGGRLQKFLGRLHPNGTLDDSFLPVIAGQQVACAVVQPNGQILIGGDFTAVNGQARSSLARLNADGSLDPTFQAGTNPPVTSLMLQADGRILVGTMFTSLSGRTVNGFGRLNQDGSIDDPFKVSASGNVLCLAGDDAGRIFAGGDFTSVNGQTRNRIAEVANLEPARRELSFDGAALNWHRSGTALELRSPCFYISTNAADWARLPEAERVADGWRIPGSGFWTNCYFRAEGFVSAGRYNGSEWMLETVTGPLLILTQPVSQTVAAGQNVLLSVVANGLVPIAYQWRKDGSPLQDATNASLSLKGVQWTNIGGYDVVVMNGAVTMTSTVANLTVMIPAVVDSWRPSSGNVNPMLLQPDGKVVVGYSKSVVRFNVDGTVDEGFHPPELAMVGGYGKSAWCFALQEDGKLIVGGSFTNQSGPPRAYLQRLHPDGTLDLSFNPEPNTIVASVAIQPDGKVLVGGYFTQMSGVERNRIARLNPDGTLDEGFNPAADGHVDALALTSDGRILVGGYFTSLSGQRRISLGRLAPDGSLDQGFAADVGGKVYCLAVQHDGKILVSGQFSILCNQNRANIGRLKPEGTLDPGFNPGANNDVGALAVQADGKIVVAGWFTSLGNQSRKYLARLHADGSLDQTFDPAPNNSVYSTVLQPDGKLLVGGYFTAMGGVTVRGLARLTTTYPATQDLSFDGSTVLWKRGGTGPEPSFATFQYWSPGAGWTSLGVGEPIAGGWRVAAVNVPPNASLRARGFVISDDSSWWFETSTGAPPEPVFRIVVDDSWFGFRSNQFGFNVSGSAGEQVVVEASTNLTDWSAVSTNSIGTGAPDFTESPGATLPSRFFRLRARE
jgi:uncharacterized delta-60 repeat protein